MEIINHTLAKLSLQLKKILQSYKFYMLYINWLCYFKLCLKKIRKFSRILEVIFCIYLFIALRVRLFFRPPPSLSPRDTLLKKLHIISFDNIRWKNSKFKKFISKNLLFFPDLYHICNRFNCFCVLELMSQQFTYAR